MRRCQPAQQLLLALGVGRQAVGGHELVGEQRRHPLLAAADAQLVGVLLLGPLHRDPRLGEGLVERGPVAVALGVGEDAVAVEDQRGHVLYGRGGRRRRPSRRPEGADVVLGHLLDGRADMREERGRIVLAGIRVQVLAVRVDEGDLQRRRDVDLGAAARDEVGELVLGQPGAAVQDLRDRVTATISLTRSGRSSGSAL